MIAGAGALIGMLLAAPAPAAEAAADLIVEVRSAALVDVPGASAPLGHLSGRALAPAGELDLFDVVFLLDTSGSTSGPSGIKPGANDWLERLPDAGRAGRRSILAAEAAAVEAMLDRFDPRTTRVGVVTFSGGGGGDHAWVEEPLTSQYARTRRALEHLLAAGPDGGTDLRAGLRLAAVELVGTRSAESEPRAGATRHVVVLTDGEPTLPARRPEQAAIRMAKRLAPHGIRVHVFAIGRSATRQPEAAVGVANATGGEFRAVRRPADLRSMLAAVDFAALQALEVRNLTTGEPARELVRSPDGGFGALVAVAPGLNRIEVLARADDGRERRVERELRFEPARPDRRLRIEQEELIARHRAREREPREPGERERDVRIDVESADGGDGAQGP